MHGRTMKSPARSRPAASDSVKWTQPGTDDHLKQDHLDPPAIHYGAGVQRRRRPGGKVDQDGRYRAYPLRPPPGSIEHPRARPCSTTAERRSAGPSTIPSPGRTGAPADGRPRSWTGRPDHRGLARVRRAGPPQAAPHRPADLAASRRRTRLPRWRADRPSVGARSPSGQPARGDDPARP